MGGSQNGRMQCTYNPSIYLLLAWVQVSLGVLPSLDQTIGLQTPDEQTNKGSLLQETYEDTQKKDAYSSMPSKLPQDRRKEHRLKVKKTARATGLHQLASLSQSWPWRYSSAKTMQAVYLIPRKPQAHLQLPKPSVVVVYLEFF